MSVEFPIQSEEMRSNELYKTCIYVHLISFYYLRITFIMHVEVLPAELMNNFVEGVRAMTYI